MSPPLFEMELRSREPGTGNPSAGFGEVGGGASPHPYSILDGAEVNGSWCYSTQTTCSGGSIPARVLDPLNPDFDGDGLRDGQEIAGWTVGIWYERTMEKCKRRRSIGDL